MWYNSLRLHLPELFYTDLDRYSCEEELTMEKIRRNERMSVMMKILSGEPGKMFTLSRFCELFGAAKSTIS